MKTTRNKAHVIGNLTADPTLRTHQNKTETTTYYNTTIEVRLWDLLHRPAPATDDSQEEDTPGAG